MKRGLFTIIIFVLFLLSLGFVHGNPLLFSDNFNGGNQSGWTVVDGGDNSSYLFQNDRYELHTESGDGSAKSLASYTTNLFNDSLVQSRIQKINSSDNFLSYLLLRINSATMSGYTCGASSSGTHVWFGKLTNGVYSSISSSGTVPSFNSSDFHLKCAVIGNKLFAKVWNASSTEPDNWQIRATDSSYSFGVNGVMLATYPTFNWDDVSVAFDDFEVTNQSGWTVVDGGDNSSYLFQNDRYELHTESGDGSAKSLASYTTNLFNDSLVQSRIQKINSSDNFLSYLLLRINSATMSGYTCGASSSGTHVWFGKLTNGVYSSISSSGTVPSFNSSDFHLKCAVIGNKLFAKVWNASSTEPDNWQIRATDSSYSFGVNGVMLATYPTFNWDDVSVAFENQNNINKSIVYVDDDWAGNTTGTEVELGKIMGYNAFINITDGINAVETGGIVYVAPGTYNERPEVLGGASQNGLTIEGTNNPIGKEENDTTISKITGGFSLGDHDDTNNIINGINLKNLYLQSSNPENTKIIRRHHNMAKEVINFTMDNCVVDGENTSGRNGIYFNGQLKGDIIFTDNEFKDIINWALLEFDGTGEPDYKLNNVTFSGNTINNCGGVVALRGKASNLTTVVNVYENTFENYLSCSYPCGTWAAIEVNRAETLNVYNNNIFDVTEFGPGWDEGQALQIWDINDLYIHNNNFINNYQGIFVWGDGSYAIPNGSIYNNTIVNNTDYGISVDPTTVGNNSLNATYNYWGSSLDSVISLLIEGNVTYHPYYIDEEMTQLATKGEEEEGNIALDLEKPYAVIKNSTSNVIITIENETDEPMVDFSYIVNNGSVESPNITINSAIAKINIPKTNITSENSSWDGVLFAPKVTTITLPSVSGETRTLSTAIELGLSDNKISFDNAVRILLPGEKNKRVGYSRTGISFTEITTICEEDNQTWADTNLGSDNECKINVGDDLVIWTKHFTIFATFTSTILVGETSSSSSGTSICRYNSNFDWDCTEWGECIEGFQTRNCLENNNCGNDYGRPSTKRSCTIPIKEKEEETIPEKLFDITFEIKETILENAQDLESITTFESFGKVPTVVNLIFSIYDENQNKVYEKETELVVETEDFLNWYYYEIDDLEPGKYTAFLHTTYGDNVSDEFIQKFEIIKKQKDETAPRKMNHGPYILLIAILLFLVFLIFLLNNKRKKKNFSVSLKRKKSFSNWKKVWGYSFLFAIFLFVYLYVVTYFFQGILKVNIFNNVFDLLIALLFFAIFYISKNIKNILARKYIAWGSWILIISRLVSILLREYFYLQTGIKSNFLPVISVILLFIGSIFLLLGYRRAVR